MKDPAVQRPKLNYDDYARIPDDGLRHEILDGEHFVSPVPGTYHNRLKGHIHYQVYQQLEVTGLGQIFSSPIDLQLSEFDIVEPDLVVVLEESKSILTEAKIEGVPQLVVEILSESTAELDRFLKMRLYEQSGVPEYWLVDPECQLVEQYVLEGDRYELAGKHHVEITSHRIPEARVDLTEVW